MHACTPLYLSIYLSQAGDKNMTSSVETLLLGTAQDGGIPQIRCQCVNCTAVRRCSKAQQFTVSMAIIDRATNQVWLIDCSPDFRAQYTMLQDYFGVDNPFRLEGIFFTHLHMG
jgi:pyrroloquinoline quinone biosynthesis protein B